MWEMAFEDVILDFVNAKVEKFISSNYIFYYKDYYEYYKSVWLFKIKINEMKKHIFDFVFVI